TILESEGRPIKNDFAPEAGAPTFINPDSDERRAFNLEDPHMDIPVDKLDPAYLPARQKELIARIDILDAMLKKDYNIDMATASTSTWGKMKAWGKKLVNTRAKEVQNL